MKINIIDLILKINPTAQVAVKGTDIDTCEIKWHNGTESCLGLNVFQWTLVIERKYDQGKMNCGCART